MYSIKNIPIEEVINNTNSFCVPEDCNHDFESIDKL
jgi:hypothetical protein